MGRIKYSQEVDLSIFNPVISTSSVAVHQVDAYITQEVGLENKILYPIFHEISSLTPGQRQLKSHNDLIYNANEKKLIVENLTVNGTTNVNIETGNIQASAINGSFDHIYLNKTGTIDFSEDYSGTPGNVILSHSNNKLTITGSSNSASLDVDGDITAMTSDKRLKENIIIIDNPLDKLQELSGFTYHWNKEKCKEAGFKPKDEEQIGVFAQDVQKVLPQAVKSAPFDRDNKGESKSGDNYLTVQYEKIVPLLIECIKDQQEQINELKKIILKK